MARYLAVVHDGSHDSALDDWLAQHTDQSEVLRVGLQHGQRLTIVSPDVASAVEGRVFMRGVARTDDALAFGPDGWSQVGAQPGSGSDFSGNYVAVEWSGDRVTVDHDLWSKVRLALTAGRGFTAASDSLLVLGSLRRALGHRVKADAESLYARSILHLMAATPLSDRTMLRDVTVLPAGYGASLSSQGWRRHGEPLAQRMRGSGDYRTAVRHAAASVTATLAAAARVTGWTTELSLSGGLDSRVLFAAAHGHDIPIITSSGNSSAQMARDYEVAQSLAGAFGVPFGRDGSVLPDGPVARRLPTWLATHAGLYDSFGPARTTRWFPRTIAVNGIGAEAAKGMWGRQSWRDMSRRVLEAHPKHTTARSARSYLRQGAAGIRLLGGDPRSAEACELLYIGFRNGFHAAAGVSATHMTLLVPLQDLAVTRLGYLPEGPSGDTIVTDLSSLLSPEVAAFEYDKPERALSLADARRRQAELGGAIEDVPRLANLGDPDRLADGPALLSVAIAESLGVTGDVNDLEAVLGGTDDDIARIPTPALREVYRKIAANGRWMVGKAGGNVRSSGYTTAKAASLALLRLTD